MKAESRLSSLPTVFNFKTNSLKLFKINVLENIH